MQHDDHVLLWRAHKAAIYQLNMQRGSPGYDWHILYVRADIWRLRREDMREAS